MKKRTALSLGILAVAFSVSVKLAFFSDTSSHYKVPNSGAGRIEESPSHASLRFTKKPLEASTYSSYKIAPLMEKKGVAKSISGDNLTDLFVQAYTGEIFARNNGGPKTINGEPTLNMPSEQVLEDFFKKADFQSVAFRRFEKKDVRISKINTGHDQIAYIESVDRIFKKYTPLFKTTIFSAVQTFFKTKDPKPLTGITAYIPSLINELLALSVPESLLPLHLELVNLWQKKLVTYQSIINSDIDPLKGYVAAKQLPSIVQEDLTIQTKLDRRYRVLKS